MRITGWALTLCASLTGIYKPASNLDAVKPLAHIRWDRLARIALLAVFTGLIALYIGPVQSWISSYQNLKERKAEVALLQRQQKKLHTHQGYLRSTRGIEHEARKMGMAKTGEQTYIVRGLPTR